MLTAERPRTRFAEPPVDDRRDSAIAAVDHQRAPFVEALERYRAAETVPFTTPGHKLGLAADPQLLVLLGADVFAADVWLNTVVYEDTLRAAEALAADAWAADRSFYLVNGSSSGNQAFLLATLQPGDEVVVARDIHKSLLVALIQTGARPIYVTPRLHPSLGCGLGIAAADVQAALDAHPATKLVALVSPSYCGVASDLTTIVDVAHARGVPVYVDEAWGPHFAFHPALPRSAMESGADGAVTSAHKLLAGLSQGSVLHVRGMRIDVGRIAATVRMTQTTSPLLPILAALDACRRQMALTGKALLERTIELAEEARRRLRDLPGLAVVGPDCLGDAAYDYDPTKLVVDVHGLGMTGYEVEQALRERFVIAPEMSDLVGVMCLVTIGDTRKSIDRLVGAFSHLSRERRPTAGFAVGSVLRSSGAIIAATEQALSPREAFFARARAIPLVEAVGEVAGELVVPYPPGIPVLVPGELITAAKVEYLRDGMKHGMYVCGPADPQLATIRVVAGFDSVDGRTGDENWRSWDGNGLVHA